MSIKNLFFHPRGIFIRNFRAQVTQLMPKKKEKSTGSGSSGSKPKSDDVNVKERSSVSLNKNGELLIAIHVKPGAKIDSITEISDEYVGVQISAPPMDGEANSAIIKYFSELLNVRKSDVDLKGGKSRQKVLTISSGNLSVSQAISILEEERGKT